MERLEEKKGEMVTLIYNGSDIPPYIIGPREIRGTFTSVKAYICEFTTIDDENIKLITSDIVIKSVKELSC
jgi:hypothetical protein